MASKLELLNLISQQVGGNAPAASELAAWQAIQASKLSIIGIQKSISGSTNETELQVIQDLVFQQGGTGTAETVLDNYNEWAGLLGVPDVPSGVTEWVGELTSGSFEVGEGQFLVGFVSDLGLGSITPSPIQVVGFPACSIIAHAPIDGGILLVSDLPDGGVAIANEIEINGTVYAINENGQVPMETSPFVSGQTYSIKLR